MILLNRINSHTLNLKRPDSVAARSLITDLDKVKSSTCNEPGPSSSQTSNSTPANTDHLYSDTRKKTIDKEEDVEGSESEVKLQDFQSINIERFVERNIAEQIKCTVCLAVPLNLTITACCHKFNCKECITAWLQTSETCTNCRRQITLPDVSEPKGFCENIYGILHVK